MSEAGETEIVPAAAKPLPTPWSIWMLVALVTFQISIVESPSVMSVSEAENATTVGTSELVVVPVDVGQQASELNARLLIRSISQTIENNLFVSTS